MNKINLLEIRENIVHADGGNGDDHTLCGITSENILESLNEYDPEDEHEIVPAMIWTDKKITCPDCASIIRYCVSLGLKSIGKVKSVS